jgi:hypothetical protein
MSYAPSMNAANLTLYLGIAGTGRARAGNTTLDNVAFGTVYNPVAGGFTSDDVGMPIAIVGGGAVDADTPPVYFVQGALFHTTIAAVISSSQVTLAAAPTTAIWNTGFATVILYRPCPFASDQATAPRAFRWSSSIAPGTSDTLEFSVLNSLGGALGVSNPYITRFGAVKLGQPVYLTYTDGSGTTELFGGYVDTLTVSSEAGISPIYSWDCQCASWMGLAKRRTVPPAIPTVYTNVAGDVAFRKLVLTYLSDDGVAVSTSGSPGNVTIAAPVGANIGQLLDQVVSLISTTTTAWYWTTDVWRTFILATRATTSAPWNVSDGSDLFAGSTPYQQSIVYSHNQLANIVYYIGQNTLISTLITTFTGTGSATVFNTPVPLGGAPTITLNAASQTVGVLGVDTGMQWYWSQGSTAITQATGGSPLGTSDVLVVTYLAEEPAVAQAPGTSLQALQAIEGSSAIYNYSTSVTQPIFPNDLLALCEGYAAEYGEPATTCQFYTLRPGLAVGQLQTIALASAGVPSGSYLIATLSMSILDNMIVWQYTAFGGANIGNAITALVQFINRQQSTLGIVTPTIPIQAAGGVILDFCIAYNPAAAESMATLTNPVAIGDVLIGMFTGLGPEFGGPALSVTDSLGNTWALIAQENQASFFYAGGIGAFWTTVTTAGTCTITLGGNPQAFIVVKAPVGITGIETSGTSNSTTPPTITTTHDDCFIVTGLMPCISTPAATAPEVIVASGLAEFAYSPGTPTEIAGIVMSYENQSSAGAFTSTITAGLTSPMLPVWISVAFRVQTPQPPPQTINVLGNPQGTVTHVTTALTANLPVLGNGGPDVKVGVAGQLVPPGGTTGEVLGKTSGADFATAWQVSANSTHSESLTDGNSNFIFAVGDIVTVVGVPN